MSLHESWPGWPTELSVSGWEKHKGVIAKIAKGETGIGAKLQDAKKADDGIIAGYYSDIVVDTDTKASCEAALKKAIAETAKVKTAQTKLAEVAKLAKAKAAEFKKTPAIPKTSTDYVAKIETAAVKFADTLQKHCVNAMKDIKEATKKAA